MVSSRKSATPSSRSTSRTGAGTARRCSSWTRRGDVRAKREPPLSAVHPPGGEHVLRPLAVLAVGEGDRHRLAAAEGVHRRAIALAGPAARVFEDDEARHPAGDGAAHTVGGDAVEPREPFRKRHISRVREDPIGRDMSHHYRGTSASCCPCVAALSCPGSATNGDGNPHSTSRRHGSERCRTLEPRHLKSQTRRRAMAQRRTLPFGSAASLCLHLGLS